MLGFFSFELIDTSCSPQKASVSLTHVVITMCNVTGKDVARIVRFGKNPRISKTTTSKNPTGSKEVVAPTEVKKAHFRI